MILTKSLGRLMERKIDIMQMKSYDADCFYVDGVDYIL